ncbi:hypothetical protein Glove_756g28 [Diversispora epigaea]|uniref:Protein kinase domain-containing protein n=1 Tax=Diversispora epigaea TaxID=1348612 RepID=A0A397FZF6_9GLOM|nr:hypothetical protein Glove_756g28 [Diversispora epigaea]
MISIVNNHEYIAKYSGISKNPSTQSYIIVMDLYDCDLHNFPTKKFWDLEWKLKIDILASIAYGLESLHIKDFIHYNLHSGNVLLNDKFDLYCYDLIIDLELCQLENYLILNNKINKIHGSIPYIPPEVLKGNEFIKKGDIYNFGGIMYEIVTAQQPFADQAHDN